MIAAQSAILLCFQTIILSRKLIVSKRGKMNGKDFEKLASKRIAGITEIDTSCRFDEDEGFTMYMIIDGKFYKLDVESVKEW